ncbi:MAG: hypothetical protein HOU81_12930 [Hamadaea sp.]|uniref:hypothetical protein n=1 Tax=Hamadaea sp. TaxID=2024425 RepID=UPI00183C6D40|nr:hypothetical protein [Hamadaea sp.]NUR71719.1 hypothetical protein [Hamadaea sp.]NUT19033.1 hypothetical protein [Hamadaea sp.]
MTATGWTAGEVLDLGCRLAALAHAHTALQILLTRRDFAPGGALDPRLTGRRVGNPLDRAFRRLVGLRRARATVVPVALARFAGALVVLVFPRAWPVLLLLWLTELAAQPLVRPGLDAGDEMLRVVTIVFTLRALTSSDAVQVAAAGFLTFQLCLAYAVAGLSKGQSAMWWSGVGLRGVLATEYFGIGRIARRLARSPGLARTLGWATIVGESLFFVAILAGPVATVIALAGAVAFHTMCAVVMGLDGFVLPFAATFPSAYWISAALADEVPGILRLLIGAVLVCAVTGWLAHWHATESVRTRSRS